MTEWIIPCNPSRYDAVSAFRALKKIEWTQSQPLSKLSVGDVVYIYLSAPEKRIAIKCITNKVDLTEYTINDEAFVLNHGDSINSANRFCELEMISELTGDEYKMENFSFTGVTTIQGPRRVTDELKAYLDNCQNKGKLSITDQFRKAFSEVPIGSIFTRQKIVDKVVNAFGSNPNSVLPSDYAYNMTNKGKPTSSVNFFMNIDVGVYQYVGEEFAHLGIEQILTAYKAAFPRMIKEETYKWMAVKQFQDNWDIDADDFAGMLTRALSKAKNLLNAAMYYPAGMIQDFAKLSPDTVREMFRDLFDESDTVSARFARFRKSADELLKQYRQTPAGTKAKNHYQDLHAVSVYLAFRYPEKYYTYKSSVADTFVNLIDYDDSSMTKMGKLESYFRMCDLIHDQIIQDTELLEMQKSRLSVDCYPDEQYRMLTMDVIYFCRLYIKVIGEWFPTIEEYDPGITKEQWLDLLNGPDVVGPIWGGFLAAFYQEKEGASCKQIGIKYGRDPFSVSGNGTNLAKRVYELTHCPLNTRENGSERYWTILFFGRKAAKNEVGEFIWKLRPELYDALTEFDIMRYEWSANEQYPIKADSWEWVSEFVAIKHCDKSFFNNFGSGVPIPVKPFFGCAELGAGDKKYVTLHFKGQQYQAYVDIDKRASMSAQIIWRTDLQKQLGAYANIAGADAKFTKVAEDTYEITISGGEAQMTVKETVEQIKKYIAAEGFSYPDGMIENFWLSLKSKPFVILAGTSGTGKTRLVKLFAKAIGAEFKLVPVRPDWSDSSDLFGHLNLNGDFVPGAILDFIHEAGLHTDKPYFLCLDEMNLARVEYYLSDFLSVIETRDMNEVGEIISDPLVPASLYGSDEKALEKYGEIRYPENLYVIGTVNMDETTFPFSKKVLDRANTIEFSFVDLKPGETVTETVDPMNLSNDYLRSEYLLLKQCPAEDKKFIDGICEKLEEINEVLRDCNAHVGYRVRDEILFYMLNNKHSELKKEDDALDCEILQKILPRLQGSALSVKEMLCRLFVMFAKDYEGKSGDGASRKMLEVLKDNDAKYPESAKKLQMMVRRFEEDGFTSYWL